MRTTSPASGGGASATLCVHRSASRSSRSSASGRGRSRNSRRSHASSFSTLARARSARPVDVAALIQGHRDQAVRGHESSEFTNSPEPSFKLGPPALAAHSIDLVIAEAHERPTQHADQRDLVQRIHQRGQESEQIAGLTSFQKRPAAGEQKRNVQAIESPLERRGRAERPHQNGDIAVFELAIVDELPDSRGYQIRLGVRSDPLPARLAAPRRC